ncbi:MAG: DUF2851 family protein [Chitinophagales bacterium]|nr:DUF2851 family protein [Chitinophagales bacterium]
MKEEFLHFVWSSHRFNHHNLKTLKGQSIQIVDYGKSNYNDGPDFLEAKIKIDDILWIGNVEIHVCTSDWEKHKHSDDPQYKNVILHVVYRQDKELNGNNIPTLELDGLIHKSIYDRYNSLMQSKLNLPCQHFIHEIDEEIIQMYYQRLTIERIQSKTERIEELLIRYNNDFEQTAFILMSKYFGLGSNSDSFQELASRIPVQWLSKIRQEENGISALLMGSAGFLDNIQDDDNLYIHHLKDNYMHYRQKWEIQTMNAQWWKWKIGRPASFPTLKLAQLAQVVTNTSSIFKMIIDPKLFRKQLKEITLHSFWESHYQFNHISIQMEKNLSDSFIERLIINVSIPMMFAYGKYIGESKWLDRALELLEEMDAEKNQITKSMMNAGLKNDNALNSQALIHLKSEYCDKRKCLNCTIGNHILKSNIYQLNSNNPDILQEAYI